MLDYIETPTDADADSLAEKVDVHRKPYIKPNLDVLGDLRTLTLGGSPGNGDSSNGGFTCVPGDPFNCF